MDLRLLPVRAQVVLALDRAAAEGKAAMAIRHLNLDQVPATLSKSTRMFLMQTMEGEEISTLSATLILLCANRMKIFGVGTSQCLVTSH
jgi:hypothetical protein